MNANLSNTMSMKPAAVAAASTAHAKAIAATDRIFATVSFCGRTIYNVSLSGMASIQDVIRAISKSVKGMAEGLVTVVVRNSSRGWTERRSLRLSGAYIPAGQQLTLF